MTTHSARQQIVIVGGGYAGVLAANRLTQHPDADITLVNPRPDFVERIRLHQLVVGNDDATEDLGALLADRVRLVVDTVDRIDAAARTLTLTSGTALGYDYLIYAVGSTGAIPENAYGLAEFESAQRLRQRLQDVPVPAPVVVVGGGLTGIETASEFAEAGRTVTLAAGPQLGPSLGDRARRSTAKALADRGVTLIEGPTVATVHPDRVVLSDGRELASAATVWTTGFGVPDLAIRSGLRTDDLGRLLTDETLTSIDDERIIAAGDAAAPSGLPLRMSCQAAMPLAAQAADTVLARLAGKQPKALNQAFTGQCVSIGRTGATIQIAHLDDSPTRFFLSGGAAARVKEAVCKATVWGLRREGRKPGAYMWLKGGKRAEHLQLAQQP